MAGRRKRRGGLRKLIRAAYRTLSVANTASYIVGGNPVKLAKHLARKRGIKILGGIIK